MAPEDRVREQYILGWLLAERTRLYWKTEMGVYAALGPYLDKGGEKLDEIRERFWDQVYPWDFHQRLYEASLSDEEFDKLKKKKIMSKADALHALYQQLTEAGEI